MCVCVRRVRVSCIVEYVVGVGVDTVLSNI